MENLNIINEETVSCWVCVLENESSGLFRIVYTLNLERYLRKIEGEALKMIYNRKFDNLIDGIGHKLFLEELSAVSVRRFVQIYNSEYKNQKTIH